MIDLLTGYDWEKVFEYAGDLFSEETAEPGEWRSNDGECNVSACLGTDTSAAPVWRKNVTRVIASSEGENDGPAWLIVVEVNDGRFAFLNASCDYTGWDCQAGGHCIVDTDLAHLIRFGIGEEDRARLGLSL